MSWEGVFSDEYNILPNIFNSGSLTIKFLFTGKQYGFESENYYLRARYYSPESARFLTRDTYDGTVNSPITQNHYLYTQGNPVMYTDPSGHFIAGVSMSISTMGILAGGGIISLGILNSRSKHGGSIWAPIINYDVMKNP